MTGGRIIGHTVEMTNPNEQTIYGQADPRYIAAMEKAAAPAAALASVKLPDTDDIAELCRAATPAAIRRLVEIALTTESEAVAVAAIKEINDRGWGKAAQAIKGDYQFTLIVNTGVNAPAMLAPIDGAVLPAVAAQIASDVASGSE